MRIIVIGAGPAGASAAYNLAKKGHNVILFEANKELAVKPCGEGTFDESFSYVDLRPNSDYVVNEVKLADFYLGDKYVTTGSLKSSKKKAYIINKPRFLETIIQNAESESAKINLGKKVSALNPYKGIVWVNSQKIEADMIILATGARSPLYGKIFGEENYRQAPAITYIDAQLEQPIESEKAIFIFYDDGYGWVFPKTERIANIGVGGLKSNLKAKLDSLAKKFRVRRYGAFKGAPVPIGGLKNRLSLGKVRVIGDAAGMVMPVTGEGIRFALYAGKIVGDKNFEQVLKSNLKPRFDLSLRMLNVFLNKLDESEAFRAIKILSNHVDIVLDGKKPSFRVMLKFGLRFLLKSIL